MFICSLANPGGVIPRKSCRRSSKESPGLCESAEENLLQRNSLCVLLQRHRTLQLSGSGRFYDFNVWSEKKLKEKLDYMHRNPVTRKLVDHPKDWPWSSWSFYENGEAGLVPIDPVG